MHDLPQEAGQVGHVLVHDVEKLELALDSGCGLSSFVLVLGARPVAFVGPAAVEVLRIAVGRTAAARPSVDQRLVLPQVAKAAARPSVDQRLVGVCVASALLWLELVLPCGRVAVALLWLTVRLPCG